jgi:hypothetical protein
METPSIALEDAMLYLRGAGFLLVGDPAVERIADTSAPRKTT